MPVVYRCRVCGQVLHTFRFVGQDFYGVPSPSEIAAWYGGQCPRCGSPLGKPTLRDVHVRHVSDEVHISLAEVLKAIQGLGKEAKQAEYI